MASIVIVEGAREGSRYPIEGAVTLGRAPSNTLCLHDPRASRQHALIRSTPDGDGYLLCDLGSGNGTYINGERIDVGLPHPLADQDHIRIGTTIMLVEFDLPRREEEVAVPEGKRDIPRTTLITKDHSALTIMMDPGGSSVTATMDAKQDMLETHEAEDRDVTIRRLRAIARLAGDLAEVVNTELLLDRVMDTLFEVFPQADRACILMPKRAGGEMEPVIGRNRAASTSGPGGDAAFALSGTVIENVLQNRQSVLSTNAQDEFSDQQSIVDLEIRSMMCVPLICRDETLGVINIDSITSNDAFGKEDLKLLTGLAGQAASAIKTAAVYDQQDSKHQSHAELSRVVPPDLALGIVDGRVPADVEGKRTEGVVLHARLEGFNTMSAELDAKALIRQVNHCYRINADVVARNNGALNRFGSDMVIANWNVMLPDENAEAHAITAALQMQVFSWHVDLDMSTEDMERIQFRVGIHAGPCTGGNIGGERFEYNVIGETVEVAESVRELATPWQVLVTDAVFEAAADRCSAIRYEPVQVPGMREPMTLYSVRGLLFSEGRMVYSIPVRVLDSSGAILGEGLITGGRGFGDEAKIFLASMPVMVPGKEVVLHFDAPELSSAMSVKGTIEDETRATHYGDVVFSKSTLAGLSAEPAVFDFLSPGSLMQSSRTLHW